MPTESESAVATTILLDTAVLIGANNLQSYCNSAELQVEVDDIDTTTFGSGGWHSHDGGLLGGTLNLGFFNDVDAGALDSIIWALFIARTKPTFEVRAKGAVVGVSNPKFTGAVMLSSWTPITGDVGDADEVSVSWPTTGPITRATS